METTVAGVASRWANLKEPLNTYFPKAWAGLIVSRICGWLVSHAIIPVATVCYLHASGILWSFPIEVTNGI